MGWIGLCDRIGAEFDFGGLPQLGSKTSAAAYLNRPKTPLATRGTLMLEAEIPHFTVRRRLLDFEGQTRNGAGRSCFEIIIKMHTNAQLEVTLRVDDQSWTRRLNADIREQGHTVRVSYAWDAASRAAVLGLYQPGTGHLDQVLIPAPRPIPWDDLSDLVQGRHSTTIEPGVEFIALSDQFEAMGPMPSITGHTILQTLSGPKPISKVTPQDAIQLEDGRYAQPLRLLRRMLPARGSLAPLRVCAPYFGLKRDFEVSFAAHLLMAGSDVEYLLGSEAVLARAAHLLDGRCVTHGAERTLVPYYQVVFDTVEVMQGPVGIQSMILPTASPNSLTASTTLLADLPDGLAFDHGDLPFPMARRYEMVTLNAARAA
ncbi:Hint domain-containing protein [Shimia ponticola]|uniref:Hint domain-containing protein n=1 Tax=Shimia ponticola TaxID=2582893 RepID=UPI0011BF7BED|nr:Hint domain-containing protein [Shimia ponticola]